MLLKSDDMMFCWIVYSFVRNGTADQNDNMKMKKMR